MRSRSDDSASAAASAARLPRHPPPRPAARPVPLPHRQRPRRDTCQSWRGAVAGRGAGRLPRHRRRRRPGGRRLPARLRHPGDPAAGGHAGADRGGGDARLRADDAGGQLAGRRATRRAGRSAWASAKAFRRSTRRSRSATGSSPSHRERARVLTWGFTLLGNAASVEPAAYFGLTHTELVWIGRRAGEIAETRGGFGPTPKLATTPGPLGGYGVIELARRAGELWLAP